MPQAKVIPYMLVVPSPPMVSPTPLAPPSYNSFHDDDRNFGENHARDRYQSYGGGSTVCGGCNCLASTLGVLLLAGLIGAAVAVPIVVTLSMFGNTSSSSTTTVSTTTTTTITSTTRTTTTSTATTTTVTTTTTDIPCSTSCTAQQTCVRGVCVGVGYLSCVMTWSRPGDGDIVVRTPRNKTIFYNVTGPSFFTDWGELDVDDKSGTGPENVFWTANGAAPQNGTYYVCFEPFDFATSISTIDPISVSVIVTRSSGPTLYFQRNFTSTLRNGYTCNAAANTLVGSFTYP